MGLLVHRSNLAISRGEELLGSLESLHVDECRRRACHALVGDPTGAQLVSHDNQIITRERLFNEDGVLRAIDDLVTVDTSTNLLVPAESCHLLVNANGCNSEGPLLRDHVVHPVTGRVVAIAGSVALDPISQRLVFTTDVTEPSQVPVQEELIPFVPYPLDPETGEPLETGLVPLARRSDLRIGAMFQDPNSGQYVPLCAVTIHPQTNTLLPVGGVHVDPIMGLEVPIHRGCVMATSVASQQQEEDGEDEGPIATVAPIVSVTFDRNGKVRCWIFGLQSKKHTRSILTLVLRTSFTLGCVSIDTFHLSFQ